MTLGEGFEIPPFDNAADITRSTRTQPGEVLADSRNWAGFALLFAAGISVVIAVTAFTMRPPDPGHGRGRPGRRGDARRPRIDRR